MKGVIIIGGGIAGLIASIALSKKGIETLVIEKKSYPLHRVCGEYISNEAVPFLNSLDLYPGKFNPPPITRLELSAVSGEKKQLPLELGGFGISRFSFDHFLYENALKAGVEVRLNTSVENVEFSGQSFNVFTAEEVFSSQVVLGSFGKRSNLDARLERPFMKRRSPYVGVKYHARIDLPGGVVALHNFPGGYCGVSEVEDQIINICYLVHREKLKHSGSIADLEKNVLGVNPILRDLFSRATFLSNKPEVINEISFEKKSPVDNRILMLGDAAGMITPLCGNGMAMAIHSAKIASNAVMRFVNAEISREEMEALYSQEWSRHFSRRLFNGRWIQRLFGSELASSVAIRLALHFKPLAMKIIRSTHGKAF